MSIPSKNIVVEQIGEGEDKVVSYQSENCDTGEALFLLLSVSIGIYQQLGVDKEFALEAFGNLFDEMDRLEVVLAEDNLDED